VVGASYPGITETVALITSGPEFGSEAKAEFKVGVGEIPVVDSPLARACMHPDNNPSRIIPKISRSIASLKSLIRDP